MFIACKQLKKNVLSVVILANLMGHLPQVYANSNPVDGLVKPKVITALSSSPIFAGRGDGITTCPVTGEKITTKKLKAEMYGRTVYFCCHGCLKAAKQIPDKYVKPTLAEQRQAVKAFLAKAQAVNSEEFCNE